MNEKIMHSVENELCSLRKGDIVSADLICHLKDTLPVVTESRHYLQLGEAADYSYTLDRRLQPIYATFTEFEGEWQYHGHCFKFETIDQSWR